MSIYRICSGQARTRGGPDWGICLADGLFTYCQWWRHETADGKRQLTYRTPEAAERARLRLEASPMPARLLQELERQRVRRALNPAALEPVARPRAVYWHHACAGCAADGKPGLKQEFAA